MSAGRVKAPPEGKVKEPLKEKLAKRSKKREKEILDKITLKKEPEKKLSVLPVEASVVSVFLLFLLGTLYVVSSQFSSFFFSARAL